MLQQEVAGTAYHGPRHFAILRQGTVAGPRHTFSYVRRNKQLDTGYDGSVATGYH